ncbi:carbohydrate ABC transporter substrate-binding protein (CUT1 family) [Hydrogenispora ethanolica]|uniref:Carbohydrate ABC transporter substrate-binding protein (CUT1 family) n=1 Tax=Hydrogenispora ethanolica TaxID=1082276 RepID=A0A4V2QCD7_HYDET|nr:ABC transporter substrate-binding protein [Hydrogenispora ethanolica]TCL59787.1 carbohydrate ABC transporter substrate-binding protein (CUT1 family) [Hydrogenispora ethanolica]
MKKSVIRSLMITLLVTLVISAPAAIFSAKKDTGPLRIMWWGSQTRHDRTLAVLDMFTKKTGIRFESEFYGFDDYIAKLNILIASGDAPDIMQLGGNFPTYIDHIEFLNKYIRSGKIDTKNTDKSFLGITTLDGKTIGLSSGTNAPAIAYDPELFKKAGVPLPTFKWTWDEWEKAVLAIHQKLGILGCSLTRADEFWALTTVVSQYGTKESLFLEPYRLKLNYKKDSYVADYLKMVQRVTKAGAYPNPAQMAEIKDIEGNPLVRGESAMAWLYSNQFVALSKAAKRPLALVCMPRRTKNGPLSQTIMSSQMFCISKTSKNKDAAAQFINFFANDVAANKILGGERGVPIMRHIREALSVNLTTPEKEVYSYLTNLGKEASTNILLDSPVQAQIRDIYIRLSEEVVLGRTAPDEAAKRFKSEAEEALKRYSASKK